MFFIKNIFNYLADWFVKKSTRNITFFVLKWLSADYFEGKFVGKTTLVCRKIKKIYFKVSYEFVCKEIYKKHYFYLQIFVKGISVRNNFDFCRKQG
jgi:hypothetical protein